MSETRFIEIQTSIFAPIHAVWQKWTQPEHVVNWNFAHESWCCPKAEVDFRVGGSSNYRMEAKDGSFGFDLIANFLAIEEPTFIASELEDGRKVEVKFMISETFVTILQRFEPEDQNPRELQQQGWQAILDQFKTYCER